VAGRFYLPLDWRWAVKAALRRIRPALLVIVETELWPNLLRAAHDSGAHVILVNARLSARSFGRYGLVKPFMRRVLSDVDRICAQTPADAERFRALGARADAVVLTGNLKFDFQPPAGGGVGALARLISKELARAQRGPILVAASTMPGEEAVILPAWARIKARHPGALLILAPRHPARFDEVARILTAAHLSFLRRTSLFFGAGNNESRVASVAAATAPATSIAQPRGEVSEETLAGQLSQVLLLDTIGELGGIFELADVVFMGGSLVPTGGHNLLEPAYWSKPIVFGPHMENFKDIAQLFLEARAALQVRDAEGLAQATLELLDDEAGRRKLGERARQILEREAGATRRTLGYIRELLGAEISTSQKASSNP
jgi:3-deoxy-D-manno-octulosonic-acid transferase